VSISIGVYLDIFLSYSQYSKGNHFHYKYLYSSHISQNIFLYQSTQEFVTSVQNYVLFMGKGLNNV